MHETLFLVPSTGAGVVATDDAGRSVLTSGAPFSFGAGVPLREPPLVPGTALDFWDEGRSGVLRDTLVPGREPSGVAGWLPMAKESRLEQTGKRFLVGQ